jgi:hypothetical protein
VPICAPSRREFIKYAGLSVGAQRFLEAQTYPFPGPKNNTGGGGGSGITLISHGVGHSTNNTSVTTAAVNTTGANFLVMVCGQYGGSAQTPSDSLSNTWSSRTLYNSSATSLQLFYTGPTATVGASQTFTCSGGGTAYPALAVAAFSNVAMTPYDVENGHGTSSAASTVQPGSITPGVANELVISGFTSDGTQSSISVDSSLTITDSFLGSGTSVCISLAYIVQSSATAVNPLWTGSTSNDLIANIASFK